MREEANIFNIFLYNTFILQKKKTRHSCHCSIWKKYQSFINSSNYTERLKTQMVFSSHMSVGTENG